MASADHSPLLDLLSGFIVELRAAGLPVSLTENLDAMQAVRHIPMEDRQAFKYALGATLVKNHSHWRAFEVVFEVYFSMRGEEYLIDLDADSGPLDDADAPAEGQDGRQGAGGGGESLSPEQLAEMLYQALMRGDEAMLRALARQAVKRYAGMEPGRPVGGTYYLYRTLRNLDLDGMLERLMDGSRQQAPAPMTRSRSGSRRTSTSTASSSSRRRSKRRSVGAWSPIVGPRRWPRRCASRFPKTSSSCTPAARR